MEELKREPRKQCSTCKDWKLYSEFFKEKKKPLGLQSRCKYCHTTGCRERKEQLRREKEEQAQVAYETEKMREAGNAPE